MPNNKGKANKCSKMLDFYSLKLRWSCFHIQKMCISVLFIGTSCLYSTCEVYLSHWMKCKWTVVENRLEIESQKTITALTDNRTQLVDAKKVRDCCCALAFTPLEVCFCCAVAVYYTVIENWHKILLMCVVAGESTAGVKSRKRYMEVKAWGPV